MLYKCFINLIPCEQLNPAESSGDLVKLVMQSPAKISVGRPSQRVKHFGCPSSESEFPKCTEDDRIRRRKFFVGCPSWGTFLGQAR